MRAFLAVVPPEQVVESLECFLEPRRDALAAAGQWRWTRTEHLHLTLAFLPELEEWREEELVTEGERWAARHTRESLAIAGAGAFPDPGAARVLWAGVEEEHDGTLAAWAKDLRAIASRVGAQVQGTRFSPHVTLARSRGRPHPAGHLLQSLDTLRTPSWQVHEVALIASFLGQGPGGTPRYEVRASLPLG